MVGMVEGRIVQVIGSTLDAEYPKGQLPEIYDALVADIVLPTGAAITAAGIIWWIVVSTSESPAPSPAISVAPLLDQDAVGLGLVGRF